MLRRTVLSRYWHKNGKLLSEYYSKKAYSSKVSPISMAFNSYTSTDIDSGLVPPLIIMHGLFGSKQNWRGTSKALEAKLNPKRKVIAVDARNHGESPHSREHTYEHLSEDIAEFLSQENIPRVAIMGHSMGGRAMMYFALKYPKLVDRAIIVDISPTEMPRDFQQMESIFLAMKNIKVSSSLSMAEGRSMVEKQLKNSVFDQGTVDFIMLNLKKLNDGEFKWTANVNSLHENFRHIANFPQDILNGNQFRGPVLFIGGSHSNFINPDDWPRIQKTFPNSQLSWLDAGHLVHFEQPAKFIELVTDFLNRS